MRRKTNQKNIKMASLVKHYGISTEYILFPLDYQIVNIVCVFIHFIYCNYLRFSLSLIQEWQLSVSGEKCAQVLVNCLED